jgi:hypothetical protein
MSLFFETFPPVLETNYSFPIVQSMVIYQEQVLFWLMNSFLLSFLLFVRHLRGLGICRRRKIITENTETDRSCPECGVSNLNPLNTKNGILFRNTEKGIMTSLLVYILPQILRS